MPFTAGAVDLDSLDNADDLLTQLYDLEEDPEDGKYRSSATAMDVNADASAAVVLTLGAD